MCDPRGAEKQAEPQPSAADNTPPTGWQYVPCPLCQEIDHKVVFTAKNDLFGTAAVCTLRRCSCGLMLTNPQPQGEALAQFYESTGYYTHKPSGRVFSELRRWIRRQQLRPALLPVSLWAEQHLGFAPFLRRFAPQVFTLKSGLSFLDFGCGSGRMLLLARELGLLAIGLEPDDRARRVATDAGLQVVSSLQEVDTVHIDSAAGSRFPAHRIDRILVRHVLEHLADPVGAIRELAERLAPEGRMLVSVPNCESQQAEAFGEYWIGYDMPRHLWHFSSATLRTLVEASGLTVAWSTTVDLPSFAVLSNEARARSTWATLPPDAARNRNAGLAGRGAEIVLLAVPPDGPFARSASGVLCH